MLGILPRQLSSLSHLRRTLLKLTIISSLSCPCCRMVMVILCRLTYHSSDRLMSTNPISQSNTTPTHKPSKSANTSSISAVPWFMNLSIKTSFSTPMMKVTPIATNKLSEAANSNNTSIILTMKCSNLSDCNPHSQFFGFTYTALHRVLIDFFFIFQSVIIEFTCLLHSV